MSVCEILERPGSFLNIEVTGEYTHDIIEGGQPSF
jgi:hypothetical protein